MYQYSAQRNATGERHLRDIEDIMNRTRLVIEAAIRGGYVVLGSSDYGERGSLLFAGTLPEVLEFARAEFAAAPKASEQAAA